MKQHNQPTSGKRHDKTFYYAVLSGHYNVNRKLNPENNLALWVMLIKGALFIQLYDVLSPPSAAPNVVESCRD